jgi:hypothetical protein
MLTCPCGTRTWPWPAVEDHNRRLRMLKYSPEHMHCVAVLHGPLAPPNSGVAAVQRLDGQLAVSAAGRQGTSGGVPSSGPPFPYRQVARCRARRAQRWARGRRCAERCAIRARSRRRSRGASPPRGW